MHVQSLSWNNPQHLRILEDAQWDKLISRLRKFACKSLGHKQQLTIALIKTAVSTSCSAREVRINWYISVPKKQKEKKKLLIRITRKLGFLCRKYMLSSLIGKIKQEWWKYYRLYKKSTFSRTLMVHRVEDCKGTLRSVLQTYAKEPLIPVVWQLYLRTTAINYWALWVYWKILGQLLASLLQTVCTIWKVLIWCATYLGHVITYMQMQISLNFTMLQNKGHLTRPVDFFVLGNIGLMWSLWDLMYIIGINLSYIPMQLGYPQVLLHDSHKIVLSSITVIGSFILTLYQGLVCSDIRQYKILLKQLIKSFLNMQIIIEYWVNKLGTFLDKSWVPCAHCKIHYHWVMNRHRQWYRIKTIVSYRKGKDIVWAKQVQLAKQVLSHTNLRKRYQYLIIRHNRGNSRYQQVLQQKRLIYIKWLMQQLPKQQTEPEQNKAESTRLQNTIGGGLKNIKKQILYSSQIDTTKNRLRAKLYNSWQTQQ